jgi:hypothetical protein
VSVNEIIIRNPVRMTQPAKQRQRLRDPPPDRLHHGALPPRISMRVRTDLESQVEDYLLLLSEFSPTIFLMNFIFS